MPPHTAAVLLTLLPACAAGLEPARCAFSTPVPGRRLKKKHRFEGMPLTGIQNMEACQDACEGTAGCLSVDFKASQKKCWHYDCRYTDGTDGCGKMNKNKAGFEYSTCEEPFGGCIACRLLANGVGYYDDHGYNNGCSNDDDDEGNGFEQCEGYYASSNDCSDEGCAVSTTCADGSPATFQCNCPPNSQHDATAHEHDLGCKCDWPRMMPDGTESNRPDWYGQSPAWEGACPVPHVCILPGKKIDELVCLAVAEEDISEMDCQASLPKVLAGGYIANFAHRRTTGRHGRVCQYCAVSPGAQPGYTADAYNTFMYTGESSCPNSFPGGYDAHSGIVGERWGDDTPVRRAARPLGGPAVRRTSGGQEGSAGMAAAAVGAAFHGNSHHRSTPLVSSEADAIGYARTNSTNNNTGTNTNSTNNNTGTNTNSTIAVGI